MANWQDDDIDNVDLPEDGSETHCPECAGVLAAAILHQALEDRNSLLDGHVPDVLASNHVRKRWGAGEAAWSMAAIDWCRFELAAFFTGKSVESLRNGDPPRANFLDTFTELAQNCPPDAFLHEAGIDPREEAKVVASYRKTGGWRPQGVFDLTQRHGRCQGWNGNGKGGRIPTK